MDFDTFIIGKKMERRGEGRVGKKKQQLLLIKHREKAAAAYQTYIKRSRRGEERSSTSRVE
jgi:hypothetical protein